MEKSRYNQIKEEAEKRVKLWVENTSFAEMTVSGSKLRFNMGIGAMGYPFEKEEWMNPEDFKRFITEEEFDSKEYDEIVDGLFRKYYDLDDDDEQPAYKISSLEKYEPPVYKTEKVGKAGYTTISATWKGKEYIPVHKIIKDYDVDETLLIKTYNESGEYWEDWFTSDDMDFICVELLDKMNIKKK
jgi:hypothetical protein